MRIVFMGTPDFAVPSLKVVASQHQLLAVVTQPDRPKGRGRKVTYSPVKQFALDLDVPIFQPAKVSEHQFIEALTQLEPDCIVVVAFGQKIPRDILELPPDGCINVHGSLLPKYRGAAPIHRAIVDGEQKTGVTTMYLSEKWDAGDIILQSEEPIGPNDTAGTMHDRLMVRGAELLGKTLREVEAGIAPRIPQDEAMATYAFKLTKDEAKVNWHLSAAQLERFVRGMNPWPTAYTHYRSEKIKLWHVTQLAGNAKPGQVVELTDQAIIVGCNEGLLSLNRVQRENSRQMSGRELANGLRLSVGDEFQ